MRSALRGAVVVALCSTLATATWAQVPADSAKRQAVRALLRAQQFDSQLIAGLDLAFSQEPADPAMPPGFMDSLKLRARRNVGTFVERLVPVYDSLFTATEVAQLTAFYESPIGQRLVDVQPALIIAMEEISHRWGLELAAEVMLELARQPLRRQ